MAPSDQDIIDNVSKLSKAGAPDEAIAQYVAAARSEQAAESGRKKYSQDDISSLITGSRELVQEAPSGVGQMSTTTGLTQEQYARRQESGAAALKALERDFQWIGTAAEIGAPIAATIATGGMALPTAIALRAAAGAASTGVRRFLQGKGEFSAEGVGETTESALLAAMPIPVFGVGTKAIIKAGATIGGIAGGASVAGKLTEKAFRSEAEQRNLERQLAAIESSEGQMIASHALRSGIGGFGFGSALHALGSAFGKFADNQSEIDATRRYFEAAGIDPTFGMLMPERAGLERTVAQSRPELAIKIDSAPTGVLRTFYQKLGEVPDNALMQEKFGKIVPVVDQASADVIAARERLTKATDALNAAKSDINTPPDVLQKLEAEHAAKLLEEISVSASAEGKVAKMMGDVVGPTEHANIVTNQLDRLNKAVSSTTKVLYSKTGLSPDQGVLPRQMAIDAAEKALDRVGAADTPYGKSILDAIKGKSAEEMSPEERQLRSMFGEDVADSISWSEYQGMRKAMSDRFGGIPAGQMDAANNAARAVYQDIGSALMKHFENTPSLKPSIGPLRTAMDFYRDISQIRDSNIGSEIFRVPVFIDPSNPQYRIAGVKASTLDGIAEAMRRGDTDTLNNIYAFVSKLGKYSPEVGQSFVNAVHSAVRENFLRKAKGNPVSVLDDLIATADTVDMIPFVESLGFGSISRIKQMRDGFKTYKPNEITSDVIDEVLTNPDVNTGITRAMFDQKVKQAALLQAAGDRAGSVAKYNEAVKLVQKLGQDEAFAAKAFADAQNNDLIAAFKGLGNYKLTAEAGATGRGTITHLIKQMPENVAVKAMGQLRKENSELADLVARKMWADELQAAIRTEKNIPGETTTFDLATFNRIFNPKNPNDVQSLKFLNAVAGPVITSDMKKFFSSVTKIEDQLRKSGYSTEVNVEKLSTAANVAGALGMPLGELGPLGLTALTRRVARAMRGGYYDFLVYIGTDKNLAKKVAAANSMVDALKKEPVQRLYFYYSNNRLMRDIAMLDAQEREERSMRSQPTR